MQSEDWPMVIVQFLGVKFLYNRGNFPKEQHNEIGYWKLEKLAKCWAKFNQSGRAIDYTLAGVAEA